MALGRIRRLHGYAPPGRIWGPWLDLDKSATGSRPYEVELGTISQAPSSFDAQFDYWNDRSHQDDMVVGPAKHVIRANCICIPKVRFRSHSSGQIIEVTIRE
jgi:hypothetical protein